MEILARRFGKKIKLPPTVQIKREILLRWLADQTEIEAAEAMERPPRAVLSFLNVCYWHLADIPKPPINVRFRR